ncbi:MAG: TonB-dependent receptor plug domain-containing protein, partial [Gammaproteobacteria bacterium]
MLGPQRVAAIQTLPKMVVTATRSERQPFDTPQAVSIISEEEIERSNQFATPDLFRYAEGVYVQRSNLGGGSPFIRGLTGKQVLLLIDGVRLNNSFYRFGPHQYFVSFRQVCGGAVRSSLAEIPVRLSRRRIRARTVRERTAIWPA